MKQIYCIIDTETKEFYQTPMGKVAWKTSKDAKCAWSGKQHYNSRTKFNEQTRFIIVELGAPY